jgi:hypothetical protein
VEYLGLHCCVLRFGQILRTRRGSIDFVFKKIINYSGRFWPKPSRIFLDGLAQTVHNPD